MNALLAAKLAKPAQPQPSALHNAHELTEQQLLWWVRWNWHLQGGMRELRNG